MNNEKIGINDVLQALPAQVYMRRGELVILFATPADLVARVAETAALLSQLDRATEGTRSEIKAERTRRLGSRAPTTGSASAPADPDSNGAADEEPLTAAKP